MIPKVNLRWFCKNIFIFIIAITDLIAQPDFTKNVDTPKKYQLQGYVKELATIRFTDDSTTFDNLIHNRLNFEWFMADNITVYLQVRNRLFTGNSVKNIKEFSQTVDINNDYFDLSIQSSANNSWLIQSMLDRAYLEWYKNDWEVRIGRQRINWGVNLVWNPNDLFNVYSFFDFDYEERPGSDAIRVKKYMGFASSFELASNLNDDFKEVVMAGMWKTNKWGYDFQLLTGKAQRDLVIGAGWAGNVGDGGFKGEVTWFQPYTDKNSFSSALLASISADYSFESSFYLHGSVLYNSEGSEDLMLDRLTFGNTGKLTVRNLSPFEYSVFLQTSYNFHPLINGGIATIYYPGKRHALFINPSVSFSVKPNLDLDLIGQFYFDQPLDQYEALVKLAYGRIKWSF